MKILACIVAIALAGSVTSCCAEGCGLPPPGPDTRTVSVVFERASVAVGDSVKATAVAMFSRGVRLRSDGFPETFAFAVTDTAIATVGSAIVLGSASGLSATLRGVRPGWARLTATINGTSGTDSIPVVAAPATN